MTGPMTGPNPPDRLRLDKWLWFARFCKSRALAAELCASGRLRCSGNLVTKPHHAIHPGDVLTFPLGRHIRVIRVLALGTRRGPAAEARTLYEDLAPPSADTALPAPHRSRLGDVIAVLGSPKTGSGT